MNVKTYSVETMRSLDRRTVRENVMSGYALMCRAGAAAFAEMEKLLSAVPEFCRLLFLAGKGNNGGDAFVMARLTAQAGKYPFSLCLACSPEHLSGDALSAWNDLPENVRKNACFDLTEEDFSPQTLVIDGLLGTGCTGPVRGRIAEWIRLVNQSKAPVLAIDVPSGLNADTGEICGEAVHADLTVTMAGVKTGLVSGAGVLCSGRIVPVRIGIPRDFYEDSSKGVPLFGSEDAVSLLQREKADSFKNRRGHLFIAGGSADYPSAPFLSAESALRSGAGLVSVLLPESAGIFCRVPRALIVRRIPDNGAAFGAVSVNKLLEEIERASAAAVGPGISMRCSPEFISAVCRMEKSVVLDADALNILAENPNLINLRKTETLLTPHPGEMRRLMNAYGIAPEDRVSDALALAAKTQCTVLLKGPRTIVAEPDGNYTLNLSGNAALATAGSGDVLTGICGAMLAGGYSAAQAGRLGAFIHGLTAELLRPVGSRGLIADDLAESVNLAFRSVLPVW